MHRRPDVAFEPAGLDLWQFCTAQRAPLERRLHDAVDELGSALDPALTRVVFGPGKRLRPALTLAFAKSMSPTSGALDQHSRALGLAASIELLHSATLVHDDLIDDAQVRRAVATINAMEGTAAAVVGGDLLIGAAGLTATRADPRAAAPLAQTLIDLCRGEAAQNSLRFDASATSAQLIEIIRLKSGSLLRLACQFGALAAGADEELCSRAARFGEHFGIVLQLVDDLLDIVSTPALAGKPVGADFTSGVVTVPAAAAMAAHPELVTLLRPGMGRLAQARSVSLLRSGDAVRNGVRCAADHAREAYDVLTPLHDEFPRTRTLARQPTQYLWRELSARIDPALAHLLPVQPAS